jgi:AraC-like DNA-binding protein
MNIENLPYSTPADFGYVVDGERPILAYSWAAEGPHRAAAHRHPRAQIIYPLEGAYWVVTPRGSWLVPARQAVWIPPNLHHEVFSHGSVTALMLFVDIAYTDALPAACMTMDVSPLLRELLKKAVEYGNDHVPGGPGARLVGVMLDELAEMETAPFFLPMSRDPRLLKVMQRILDNPADDSSLEAIAKEAGASPRTLARLFRRDAGMTFAQWKTQARLIEAIDRLGRGQSVTEVAFDLGYGSPSAFIYMFRRKLGVAPGRYRRRLP